MTRFVLDASIALAWLVERPAPTLAITVRQALAQGARGVVPALWHLEMANGLVVADRRGFLAPEDVETSLADIESLLLAEAIEADTTPISVRNIFATASDYRLTAYDAAYLDLARRESVPLATLDQALRAAARRAGVELLR